MSGWPSTLLFCAFCISGALAAYVHRPGRSAGHTEYSMWWVAAVTLLPLALLLTGERAAHGDRLSLEVQELRLPLADIDQDGTYFVVGPEVENSDLVVGPYADPQRSSEIYQSAFEGLLTIKRDEGAWQLCGRNIPYDAEASLPGMRLQIDGVELADGTCIPLLAATRTVLIGRVDGPAPDDFRKRRHLYVSLQPQYVSIGLKDDETLVQRLDRCSGALNEMGDGPEQALRLAPAGLHQLDLGYREPKNVVFDQLGQGGENAFLDPMRLGPIGKLADLCRNQSDQVEWPRGENQARLVISTQTNTMGWKILTGITLLLLSCSYLTVRACKAQWRDGGMRAEAVVVIGLQWLLTLRLLIALAGLVNDHNLILADIIWPPAIAFACVPPIAVALLRSDHSGIAGVMRLLALQIVISVVIVLWMLDWQMPGTQTIILVLLALLALLARSILHSEQPFLFVLLGVASWCAGWLGFALVRMLAGVLGLLESMLERFDKKLPAILRKLALRGLGRMRWMSRSSVKYSRPSGAIKATRSPVSYLGVGLCISIMLLAARGAAFGIFGIKERIDGLPGLGRLPVSLIYAPISIIAMAFLICAYRREPKLFTAMATALAFGSLFVLMAAIVKDLGLLFIFALPVAWVLAKLAIIKPEDGFFKGLLARGALLSTLVIPLLVPVLFFLVKAEPVPTPQTDLAAHMLASSQWDPNLVRLQRLLDAEKLVDIGNIWAMNMLEQAAQLEPITGDLVGRGYMERSNLVMPLLGYQYSDNLLAAHITWPFGRIGLAVLLGSLFLTLLAFAWPARRSQSEGWMTEASRLAAMTLFWSGAYMALANLNLAPFTGRNFYLLAARSMGDLMEGLVLLLLVALPWVVLRQRPAKPEAAP